MNNLYFPYSPLQGDQLTELQLELLTCDETITQMTNGEIFHHFRAEGQQLRWLKAFRSNGNIINEVSLANNTSGRNVISGMRYPVHNRAKIYLKLDRPALNLNIEFGYFSTRGWVLLRDVGGKGSKAINEAFSDLLPQYNSIYHMVRDLCAIHYIG